MDESLIVERHGRVAVLIVNRERRRNALDDATLVRLQAALATCAREDVAAIVLAGAGTKAFSAGSDIKELEKQTIDERRAHTDLGQRIADQIEEHACPVIAAIEGYCLGGGLELASACDYRIAGAEAIFGLPEVRLGALPSWGGTFRLPRLIGAGRARELVQFDRRLNAQEARAWGLVAEVVPAGQALARARALAAGLAEATKRETAAIAKRLVTYGADASMRAARHLEYLADMVQTASADFEAGVAKFGEKAKGG